jgi:undecaprenyl-diphosphatase
VGTVVSAGVGYVAIAWLLRYLQQHTTAVFITYRIMLGAAILYALQEGILN